MGDWTGTIKDWANGAVVTDTDLDTNLRDFATAFTAWTAYTPTWTSSGTQPAIGNGTIVGSYVRVQKTIHYKLAVTLGSTSTVGTGNYIFSLPATASTFTNGVMGFGIIFDSSASTRFGRTAYYNSSTSVALVSDNGTVASATSPAVPATSDIYTISGTYEAA